MTKTFYAAKREGAIVGVRLTARAYSHAVIDAEGALAYSASLPLAMKAAAFWRGRGLTVEIVEAAVITPAEAAEFKKGGAR